MNQLFQDGWLIWAIALTLGFPCCAIGFDQLQDELRRRQHPLTQSISLLRNGLLPLVVLYLLLEKIFRLSSETTSLKLLLSLILIGALYLLLSFINGFVFGAAQGNNWRAKTPRLLRDMVIVFLVALGGAVVFAEVWGQDLAGIAAALGLGSIVIGLALQETLGNVMSGISLLMERPFSEGDWIEMDGIEGRVAEINWRAVRILDRKGNLVVVPHTTVAQATLVNNTAPAILSGNSIEVGFSYSHPPNLIKQMLQEAVQSTPGIISQPQPVLRTVGYGDSAINYEVIYWIDDHRDRFNIRERLMTRIWYGCQRRDINIPFPIRTLYHFNGPRAEASPLPEIMQDNRERSPLIQEMLNSNLLDEVAQGAKLQCFAQNETIVQQGHSGTSLYIVLSGKAQLTMQAPKRPSPDAAHGDTTHGDATNSSEAKASDLADSLIVATLERGEFFGALALMASQPSPVTVTALHDLSVLTLNAQMVNQLIERRPSLAVELGQAIDMRRRAIAKLCVAPER